MTKRASIIGLASLFSLTSAAEDIPRMETFLGYSYVRFHSATNVPAFSANGGDGQYVYNFNRWIGAVADLGAVHNGNISGVQFDSTVANFMFGPRMTIHHASRFVPYGQALWGGVYATTSIPVDVVLAPGASHPIYIPGSGTIINNLQQAFGARVSASQTAFAMAVGGGLDIKISKHLNFRPIGLDYYLTRLQNFRTANDNNQHNLRYIAGINFTFGAQ